MLLRIDEAAILLFRETTLVDSLLSESRRSSGMGPSGKAQA